ncbi:MAG: hypothetical protein JW963_20805 [Anaerolineales bacterium]|nr:hypothetical protein [Anaerolineales bacterium]
MENNQITNMLKLTRGLFFLNAAVWVVFGVLGFMAVTSTSDWRLILSMLMIANAAIMIWFGVKITAGQRWVFFLAILYVALNVVLSITDQFGWIDALILLFNLCLLGLLFLARQRMNRSARVSSGEM